MLVMATEQLGKSAILQTHDLQFVQNNYTLLNLSTFTPKFRFENSKCQIYWVKLLEKLA